MAWLAAAGLFSAFSAVNILLLTQGVTRCGCLGDNSTSPGWMLALDATVLLILGLIRPSVGFTLHDRETWRRLLLASTSVGVGMTLLYLAAGSTGWPRAAFAQLTDELLSVDPAVIDFGVVMPGQSMEKVVEIRNLSRCEIHLLGGTANGFIDVRSDLPMTLQPGETRRLRIRVQVPEAMTCRRFRRSIGWYYLATDGRRGTYRAIVVFALNGRT